jgi:hypothetical protein
MKIVGKSSTVLALMTYSCLPALAQTPQAQIPTFRAETQLVMVDVVADIKEKTLHTRALLTDLKKEDVRVFDNGHEMPIRSFDIGAHYETRPIALWLIVQCNDGVHAEWHSEFLRNKTQLLRPALAGLHIDDAIGGAHWCDDGTASVDLPAGRDPGAAVAGIDRVISGQAVPEENGTGETAMQKMIRLVLDNVHQATPQRLPVFLFLYGDDCGTHEDASYRFQHGDHCGTPEDEAHRMIEDVLETSGVVFGMNDNGYSYNAEDMFHDGRVFHLVHYYSHETGGQFYSTTDPRQFSAALDYILLQLHLRYTIGFKPLLVDGKRHALKVELTKEAAKRFPGAEMRFRQEYIPVAAPSSAP